MMLFIFFQAHGFNLKVAHQNINQNFYEFPTLLHKYGMKKKRSTIDANIEFFNTLFIYLLSNYKCLLAFGDSSLPLSQVAYTFYRHTSLH